MELGLQNTVSVSVSRWVLHVHQTQTRAFNKLSPLTLASLTTRIEEQHHHVQTTVSQRHIFVRKNDVANDDLVIPRYHHIF